MAFDFKKEFKEFYMPKNKPAIVTVPKANYIAVRGKGNPNEEGGAYQQAISVLYAVAYTLKMSYKTDYKIEGFFEYVVPPLEGFWWQENVEGVDYSNKDTFNWISVIRLPDFVTKDDFNWAVDTATKKKKLDCSSAEFLTIDEGLCVQIMHIGPFDNEPENESGTLVVWQKLDRLKSGEINFELSLGRKIDRVRDHLSLVYHRYLAGESGITKLKLSINGEKIKGIDPFLTEKSVQAMDDETLVIQGNKILVRPYILPHISKLTSDEIKMLGGKDGLRKQQGFYVYRNKRLLVWGTWFRMMRQGDLSKLARIRVDIPNTLDDLWTLDIKKSSALPPAEVRKNLEIIINQIAERSKRTWTFRGKKEISDTETHVWNRMKNKQGGFYYEVNREHPLVQQMIKAHPDIEVSLNALLQQIEMGLPLNQLYVDLNNDEQITNDNEQSDVEIVKSLQEMITMCADKQEKCNLLDAIACIDPYSSHLDIVEKFKEEILKND